MALIGLNRKGQLTLKDGEEAREIRIDKKSREVLLLVDTSGSMAGNKMAQAKLGAVDFACSANAREYATGLAIFGDRAAMVCDPTRDLSTFSRKVGKLEVGMVGGSTDLAAALTLANKFKSLHSVIVITDGQPNSREAALAAAVMLRNRGIDILCIGTDDADHGFLTQLATRTDLAVHVASGDLRNSIGNSAKLLLAGR